MKPRAEAKADQHGPRAPRPGIKRRKFTNWGTHVSIGDQLSNAQTPAQADAWLEKALTSAEMRHASPGTIAKWKRRVEKLKEALRARAYGEPERGA